MTKLTENFNRSEFACNCGCGLDTVDSETVRILQEIRDHYNKPITINSGCRCKEYNDLIGGSKNSQHVKCRAVDFYIKGEDTFELYVHVRDTYPDIGGIGRYPNFIHIDTRTGYKARW
jgi:uncharacterized protein YcbK (DUF882 family)